MKTKKCNNYDVCDVCNKWWWWKYCIKNIVDFIRWDELVAMFTLWFFPVMMFGWWAVPLCFILHSVLFTHDGGAVGDFHMDYPYEDYEKLECSAGIEDCEYCGNGYEHSFNENYDKNNNKWYHKI